MKAGHQRQVRVKNPAAQRAFAARCGKAKAKPEPSLLAQVYLYFRFLMQWLFSSICSILFRAKPHVKAAKVAKGDHITVYLKVNDATKMFRVRWSNTTNIFKEWVAKKVGLDVDAFYLTHQGSQLTSGNTLRDCNIQDGTTVFLSERLLGGSGRGGGVRRGQRKRLPVFRDGFVRSDSFNNEDVDDVDDDDDDNYNAADDVGDLSPAEKRRKDNKGDVVQVRGTKKPVPAAAKVSAADFLSDHTGSLMRKWALADSQGTLKDSIEKYNSKKTTKSERSIMVRKINGARQAVVQMVCCVCKKVKDLLPEFWNRNSYFNHHTCKPGHESFPNDKGNPCKVCKVGADAALRSTTQGWVRMIMNPYKNLGGEAWFWKQWKTQGGDFTVVDGKYSVTKNARCTKTGLEMIISGKGINTDWCPSINNLSPDHRKPSEHIAEHCELIVAELNVQQKGAIPDLALAAIQMIKNAAEIMKKSLSAGGRSTLLKEGIAYSQMLAANWNNSAKQNGVTASLAVTQKRYQHQYANKTVRGLCSKACDSHAYSDAKLKRTPAVSQLTPIEMYRRWWSRCRCTYSHIIVSLIQGFTRVSVDRVGPHNCSHELKHVELCIRLLNSPAGMTRKKFCFLMINQTKMKLVQGVLKAYKNELAALEKGGPLPEPEEWLRPFVSAADDDDDVEDSNLHEDEEVVEEVVVDEEVVDEEEDGEDGDEVDEHLEGDDDSQAHSSADSDDSDDESYLPGDDEEEDDIDDVIDLVVEDDDVLAGYIAPQNIFIRFYNEVLQNWATVRTNWISLWQRMSGLFFTEAPAMEEENLMINDDVVIPILDEGNEVTTIDLNEPLELRLNDFVDDIDDLDEDNVTVVIG
jgi:hypothetical protein